jgi:hypothetical protein
VAVDRVVTSLAIFVDVLIPIRGAHVITALLFKFPKYA